MITRRGALAVGLSALLMDGRALAAEPLAYRFYGGSRTRVPTVAYSPAPAFTADLIVLAGYYAYSGRVYDLSRPGLYRLMAPAVDTTSRVVYGGDAFAVLSAAAWWGVHGTRDGRRAGESDADFLNRLNMRARTSKLRLQCAEMHFWAQRSLLAPCGIASRTVRFLTAGTTPQHLNGYDEGHVCMEVGMGSSWALVDLTGNRLFRSADGGLLSAKDAPAAIASGAWDSEFLANDGYSVEPFEPGKSDETTWAEMAFLTPEDQNAWYERIFQAVGIEASDGRTYWKLPPGGESRKAWVEGLAPGNWIVLSPSEWDARFYPSV